MSKELEALAQLRQNWKDGTHYFDDELLDIIEPAIKAFKIKEIIVSVYDGGYYWSFCSGNRIYSRDGYENGRYVRLPKIDKLCYCLKQYCRHCSVNKFLEDIHELYPQCSKLILSEDGGIEIYNIKKRNYEHKNII